MKLIDQLKIPFLIVLFTLMVFFASFRLFGPIPFTIHNISTTKNEFFTVSGVGEIAAIPDTAQISLGVTKTAQTVKEAQNSVNNVVNNLTDALKRRGIEVKNIKTTDYSVTPDIDYLSGSRKTKSYTVTQSLSLKIKPLDKANQVIDIATSNGANLIGGIIFTFDDQMKKELENKARVEAIQNARDKAISLAGPAGMRLGRIVNISENDNLPGGPIVTQDAKTATDTNQLTPQTQIQPGENKIRITVTLSYETL